MIGAQTRPCQICGQFFRPVLVAYATVCYPCGVRIRMEQYAARRNGHGPRRYFPPRGR